MSPAVRERTKTPAGSGRSWQGREIRGALAARGTPIGSYDVLIAARALQRNVTLVTANVAEFSRVDALRWAGVHSAAPYGFAYTYDGNAGSAATCGVVARTSPI